MREPTRLRREDALTLARYYNDAKAERDKAMADYEGTGKLFWRVSYQEAYIAAMDDFARTLGYWGGMEELARSTRRD